MNHKPLIACLLVLTPLLFAPLALARESHDRASLMNNVAACASYVCTETQTTNNNYQVWTCGGSGNVILITGNNNDVKVCSGGNNNTG